MEPTSGTTPHSTATSKPNSTAKLLRVLEAVCEPPSTHRLTTLVTTTGLAKTSVYRLLGELIDNGFVMRDGDGRYRPDTALKVLAAEVRADDDSKTIRTILTELQRRVGNTIHYAVRTSDHAIYMDKVEGAEQAIRMASQPGTELQLHSTAIGKAILANLPEDEVRAYAHRTGLPSSTSQTITTLKGLLADGRLVRTRGFAIDDQENENLIRCIAVAVPDSQGHPLAGVSISTVAALVPLEELQSYAEPLANAAREISAVLGR